MKATDMSLLWLAQETAIKHYNEAIRQHELRINELTSQRDMLVNSQREYVTTTTMSGKTLKDGIDQAREGQSQPAPQGNPVSPVPPFPREAQPFAGAFRVSDGKGGWRWSVPAEAPQQMPLPAAMGGGEQRQAAMGEMLYADGFGNLQDAQGKTVHEGPKPGAVGARVSKADLIKTLEDLGHLTPSPTPDEIRGAAEASGVGYIIRDEAPPPPPKDWPMPPTEPAPLEEDVMSAMEADLQEALRQTHAPKRSKIQQAMDAASKED